MICPNCGKENPDSFAFCAQCGNKLAVEIGQDAEMTPEGGNDIFPDAVSPVESAPSVGEILSARDTRSPFVSDAVTAEPPGGTEIVSESVSGEESPEAPVTLPFSSIQPEAPVTEPFSTIRPEAPVTLPFSSIQPEAPATVAVASEKPELPVIEPVPQVAKAVSAAVAAVPEPAQAAGPVSSSTAARPVSPASAAQIPEQPVYRHAATQPQPAQPPKQAEPFIPKDYRALSTAGIFWFIVASCIPVAGLIMLLAVAFGGKNRNRRSLSRAILVFRLLFLLIACVAFIIAFFFFRDVLVNMFDPDNWINLGEFIVKTFFNH